MSVITFPERLPAQMTWGQHRNDIVYRSSFGSQSIGNQPPMWKVSLVAATMTEEQAGEWKAFLLQLRGATNQVALWDLNRPAPLGSLRGVLTVGTAVAAGDTTIVISAGAAAAGQTLAAGDMLGFGGASTQQVVMAAAPATVDGSGNIAVSVEPPVRNALAVGDSVIWDKPKALFRMQTTDPSWNYTPGQIASGFAIDLMEDWRP